MIRRAYIDEQGASWDSRAVARGYGHWFDDEIVTAAKQRARGRWAHHSKVEHLHPLFGLAADDDVRAGPRAHRPDKALFRSGG
jgi:hypothetical protein